jgi:hypothetical protein
MDDSYLYYLFSGVYNDKSYVAKDYINLHSDNFNKCPDAIPKCEVSVAKEGQCRMALFYSADGDTHDFDLECHVCLNCNKVYLHGWEQGCDPPTHGTYWDKTFSSVEDFLRNDEHWPGSGSDYMFDRLYMRDEFPNNPVNAIRHLMFIVKGATYPNYFAISHKPTQCKYVDDSPRVSDYSEYTDSQHEYDDDNDTSVGEDTYEFYNSMWEGDVDR